jgi:FtsZ-interacting cell division protein ZipA
VQFGLNLIATDAAFAGTKIRALAEANGLALQPDGTFYRFAEDENGNATNVRLYSMTELEGRPFASGEMKHLTARGITLLLDVPNAAREARAFDLMVAAAKHFSKGLGADITDDQKRVMKEPELQKVKAQLDGLHEQMRAFGILPGSALAARLFS